MQLYLILKSLHLVGVIMFIGNIAVTGAIPDAYWRLEKLPAVFGVIATLLPLAAVPVMVFKAG